MNRLTLKLSLVSGALGVIAGAADARPEPSAQVSAYVPAAQIQADLDGNGIFEALEAKIASPEANKLVEVVLRFREDGGAAEARIARRISRRLAADGSVVARLTPKEVRQLAASGAIQSAEEVFNLFAVRDTAEASFGTTKATADFGLDGDNDGDPNRYSRQDLTIAVLDTGIDPNHPDFRGGKIIGWRDFVSGRTQPYDDHGHGTHCASIAAGRVVNGVGGVAPGASLVGVKVLGADGQGSSDTIAAAVDWCVANRHQLGIEVLSMSLSTPGSSDGTDVVSRAVNRAVEAGLVVCVAAGNAGPSAFTVGSPSAAAGAITVGNMLDAGKGGFALNASSSRGPTADGRVKPDVCAPGTQILAARANTAGYTRMTGTSMACPFVAGVAALMLDANATLTADDVKSIMKKTAVHFGPEGENNEFGAGRLDGYAAIAKAACTEGTAPPAPDHLFGAGALAGAGDFHTWTLPIDDTRFPLAVTLIMPANVDFDLYVYDPAGNLVGRSEGNNRQEMVLLTPGAGVYQIEVDCFSGAGRYSLDISAGSSLK